MVLSRACKIKGCIQLLSPSLQSYMRQQHQCFLHFYAPSSASVCQEKSRNELQILEGKNFRKSLLSMQKHEHNVRPLTSISPCSLQSFMYVCSSNRHQISSHSEAISSPLYWMQTRQMAGHSKFSNIKHRKEAQDGKRSGLLSKLIFRMRTVVKEGGGNPKTNASLAAVIDMLKKQNTPSDKIEGYLKKIIEKSANSSDHLIEIRGAGNSMFIVQVYAESAKKALNEVNALLKKTHATVVPSGSLTHFFERKGVVSIKPPENPNIDLEEIAIECGAEDVAMVTTEEDNENIQFVCEADDLLTVKKELETQGYEETKGAGCKKVNSCKCEQDDGKVIDLSPLAKKGKASFQDVLDVQGQDSFSWNPCKSFSEGDCKDVAVCQIRTPPGSAPLYFNAGTQDSAQFIYDDTQGILALQYQADTVDDEYGDPNEVRLSLIDLVCDESQEKNFVPTGEVGTSTYFMTLKSKYACPRKPSLSAGTILIIIFFSLLFVYLVGGIAFQIFIRKESGRRIFPNSDFWISLPNLIKDGVFFVLRFGKGKGSYSGI